MSSIELFGLGLALAACAGLNCYLAALLLAVGFRLGWPGMSGFELLSPTGVMVAFAIPFLVEFAIDKVPRVNLWWGGLQLVIRPVAGASFAALAVGSAGGVAMIGAAGVGLLTALAVHLGRTRLRRALNRSREPFSNVAASLLGEAIVVVLFTLAMRAPLAAGGGGVLLAATGGALALGCCRSKGQGSPAGDVPDEAGGGSDGSGADHDQADGVEA